MQTFRIVAPSILLLILLVKIYFDIKFDRIKGVVSHFSQSVLVLNIVILDILQLLGYIKLSNLFFFFAWMFVTMLSIILYFKNKNVPA